jgi:hypothetical protein
MPETLLQREKLVYDIIAYISLCILITSEPVDAFTETWCEHFAIRRYHICAYFESLLQYHENVKRVQYQHH